MYHGCMLLRVIHAHTLGVCECVCANVRAAYIFGVCVCMCVCMCVCARAYIFIYKHARRRNSRSSLAPNPRRSQLLSYTYAHALYLLPRTNTHNLSPSHISSPQPPPPLSLSLSISGESANYQRLIHEFLEKVRACGSDYRAALQVSLWRAHSLSLDVCICERVRVDACIPLHARVRWSKPEPLSSGATDV